MPAKFAAITLGLLLAAPHAAAADPDKQVLAARAREVLKAHCYRSHGQEGSVEGAMNYVADLPKLVDLNTLDRRARRFQRYFTLTHLHNAGLSQEELQTYRNALAMLVNSLSWNPRVTNPVPVDSAKTVLRIDLRWYMWDSATWNRI